MERTFEWDPRKAAANRRKHGISFEQAIESSAIPWLESSTTRNTPSAGNRRVLLVVCFVQRGDRIRIFSARRANWLFRSTGVTNSLR
jgi:uncharacterized DUF497 family protein